MRYMLRLLCVCALGVMPLVGCFGDFLEESDPCEGVVCPEDGDECTVEFCVCFETGCNAKCVSGPAVNGTDCTFDGIAGVCVSGMCGENLCEGVLCDDADACTDDTCDYLDGTCSFPPVMCDDYDSCTEDTCNPADGCNFTPIEGRDGTQCSRLEGAGMCEDGVCVAACDPSSEREVPCPTKGHEDWFCCPGSPNCVTHHCNP
jgi:hypothetical protein